VNYERSGLSPGDRNKPPPELVAGCEHPCDGFVNACHEVHKWKRILANVIKTRGYTRPLNDT
jgi:hypothetical protein